MPIAATTPSAVRSSGSTHRGRRRAILGARASRGLASRKLGSRSASTVRRPVLRVTIGFARAPAPPPRDLAARRRRSGPAAVPGGDAPSRNHMSSIEATGTFDAGDLDHLGAGAQASR